MSHRDPTRDGRGDERGEGQFEIEWSQPSGRSEQHGEMKQDPNVKQQHTAPQEGCDTLVTFVAAVEVAQQNRGAQSRQKQDRGGNQHVSEQRGGRRNVILGVAKAGGHRGSTATTAREDRPVRV